MLLGTLTREELALVTSAFGGLRATFGWGGSAGRRFVRTAARLGLSKWHAGRAMQARSRTVSLDWIVPLRQELAQLRMEVSRSMGRPVPMPQAWTAMPQGQVQAQPRHAQQQQQPYQGPHRPGGSGGGYPPQGWGGR